MKGLIIRLETNYHAINNAQLCLEGEQLLELFTQNLRKNSKNNVINVLNLNGMLNILPLKY